MVIAIMAGVLVGCGGSSESGNKSGNSPDINSNKQAEATTQNALLAYGAMSRTTYVPSLAKALYDDLYQNGNSEPLNCNRGGVIKTRQYDIHKAFNAGTSEIEDMDFKDFEFQNIVSATFDQCYLEADNQLIFLDGTLYMTKMQMPGTKPVTAFTGFITEGFLFKIDDDLTTTQMRTPLVSMHYKHIAMKKDPAWQAPFQIDAEGSYFTINSQQGMEYVSNLTAYDDINTGYIEYAGGFIKADHFQSKGYTFDGIRMSIYDGEWFNLFMAELDPVSDKYFENIYIKLGSKGYLELAENLSDEDQKRVLANQTPLAGKWNKVVWLWQDDTETVHAQNDDGSQESSTTDTPAFYQ